MSANDLVSSSVDPSKQCRVGAMDGDESISDGTDKPRVSEHAGRPAYSHGGSDTYIGIYLHLPSCTVSLLFRRLFVCHLVVHMLNNKSHTE